MLFLASSTCLLYINSIITFSCLVCTADDLPVYTNAQLQDDQFAGLGIYNPRDQVDYKCNDGFFLDQSIPALSCFCIDNLVGTASWTCTLPERTTACKRSKQLAIIFLKKYAYCSHGSLCRFHPCRERNKFSVLKLFSSRSSIAKNEIKRIGTPRRDYINRFKV